MARRVLVAAPAVLAGFVLWAVPAGAHPFLVRTDPADGARLERAPQTVSLQFSEPLGSAPPELSISRQGASREVPLVADRASGGRVVVADVALGVGIYQLSWRVVADDGHLSEGVFAFAVGPVGGSLPRATAEDAFGPVAGSLPGAATADAPASPLRVAAGWVFFAGLALSLGAVATAVAVDRDRGARQHALAAGLVVAMTGSVVMWVAGIAGVGGPVGPIRQHGLLAAVAALLAVAVILRRRPAAAGVIAVAAAAAWSARGQVGVSNGAVGTALDGVHLVAGAVWAGALTLLVADLWRARHDPAPLAGRARRYASLGAIPVAVLAVAGVVSAVLMVPTAGDLADTTYGRLLVAKTALFAAAVALAWRARRRLAAGSLTALLRLTRPEAALVGAVLVLAAVLANTAPPPPRVAAASLLGPPPLSGPVVRDAGLAGILTVAVAVGDGQLQVEVLVPGDESDKARAKVTVNGTGPTTPRLTSCGDGCLAGPWQPRRGTTTISVAASAPGWRGGSFTTTIDWPPPPEDPSLLERVLAAMRAEPLLVEMVERTSSGPDSVVTPMTYRGSGAELVGEAPYASGGADDVRLLPSGDGLRLYLPGDRLWVTIWLDEAGRITRERIVDVGLQIDHEYRYDRQVRAASALRNLRSESRP